MLREEPRENSVKNATRLRTHMHEDIHVEVAMWTHVETGADSEARQDTPATAGARIFFF